MAGVVGIEPTSKVLETFVLPLNYTPNYIMVEGERFELPNPMGADLQSAAFSHFATPPLYQIKLILFKCGSRRNRTADTRIFSPLLYRLSYRAEITNLHGDPDGTRTRDLQRDR